MASPTPSRPSPTHPAAPASNPFRPAGLALLTLALALSAYLVHVSLGAGQAAGCDAGNCGVVLGSKWAKVFGVPVGLLGAASYLVLGLLALKPFEPRQRGARLAATTLALLIPAAALWFLALQVFVIGAFCPWCCTTHAIATTAAFLLMAAWKRDATAPPSTGHGRGRSGKSAAAAAAAATAPVWGVASGIAAVAMAGFVVVQAISPEPPRARPITATMGGTPPPAAASNATPATTANTATPIPGTPTGTSNTAPSTTTPTVAATTNPPATNAAPAGPRVLSLHEGRFQVDPRAYPCNGTPDAEHLVLMISDYTCPHCRAAYKILKEVRETFSASQLSYLMLPSHHGGDSLDLQLLLLTAWRLDPSVWTEVSSDLYLERLPLKPDAVRQLLRQRLGADRLEPALKEYRPWIETTFALARDIHAANKARTGSGSIPQLIIGSEIVVGSPADATDLFRLLEKNLGLARKEYPDLRLTRPDIDLGRVFAGTGPTVAIPFTNAGSTRLVVSRATVPQGGRPLRGLQVPIEPGATGLVEVAVAIPRDPGRFEQIVTLFSNSRTADHQFSVKGESWKPIRVDPALLDLGRIDPDASTPTQGVMRIELDEPVKLLSVTSQNPNFTAVLREVTPARKYEVLVSPARSIPTGPQQTALMVALEKPVPTGWPENMAFAARALVEAAVSVLPQRMVIPPGALTADRHQQILVRCTDGTGGFAVEGATIEGGTGIAAPQIAPGAKTNEFLVRFTLPTGWSAPPPPQETRVSIRTTHPRYPTVSVPLAVQGR